MSRKPKVTQEAVNQCCDKLVSENKNITMHQVIQETGGSFSTISPMVKAWRDEQAAKEATPPELPEGMTKVMHRAANELWLEATRKAEENIARIKKEAAETVATYKEELDEHRMEISRLEGTIENINRIKEEREQDLDRAMSYLETSRNRETQIETKLSEKEIEIERLRNEYKELQKELLEIAKANKETETINKN